VRPRLVDDLVREERSEDRLHVERPVPGWRSAAALGVVLGGTALVLHAMGRGWWCKCGEPDLFSWHVWSRHNSQHVIDPYTFSHVLHGLAFYGLGFLLVRTRPFWERLSVALVLEAAWEIAENTDRVIERYREATISLDYFGDSVINSLADVLACAAGFLLAAAVPAWLSMSLFVATEVAMVLSIRDCLMLNVVMLLYPIDAIKEWQMGS
jgi:hypothetical protein